MPIKMNDVYTLDIVKAIIQHYTTDTWGKKAVIPAAPWSIENIATWIIHYANLWSIDILLPLAQGVLECHFGVNPAAKRSRNTMNIYNVGNVDTGANETQSGWEAGINRYCQLLRMEYNWKEDPFITVESMVKHDFHRPRGGRYASAPSYTTDVQSIANHIKGMM